LDIYSIWYRQTSISGRGGRAVRRLREETCREMQYYVNKNDFVYKLVSGKYFTS